MTSQELELAVWELIDKNCMEMSQAEYLEFLRGFRDDASMRAEAVEEEIENELNSGI